MIFDLGGRDAAQEDPGVATSMPNNFCFGGSPGSKFSMSKTLPRAPASELNLSLGSAPGFDFDPGLCSQSSQKEDGSWHNPGFQVTLGAPQPQLRAAPPPPKGLSLALDLSTGDPVFDSEPPLNEPEKALSESAAQKDGADACEPHATLASEPAKEAADATPAEILEEQPDACKSSPQKQRPASVTQQNLKPPLAASGQAKAAARAPPKPPASPPQLNLTLGSQAAAKQMPALASGSKKAFATSSNTIAKKVQAAPSSLKSAMPPKPLQAAPLEPTKSKQGQDPLPMEIETPVTDRKRSHDKMESLAPAQGGPGKALMDFEEESRGNLEDSDVADDDAFQNSRKASKIRNDLSEAQWAQRMQEMIKQICNTREGLQEVRVECKSTVEEVDVLSLRASEASAEIAFVASSHSTYSLTSYADSLHNMLKQLESEPDDPFNSSGEEMETE